MKPIIGRGTKVASFVMIGVASLVKVLPTRIGENSIIREFAVIYDGNIIGNSFQTGHHVLIRESNKIGDNVSIGSHTVVEHHVVIGNNVRIHSNVFIPEYTVLEDDCWIGPGVVFANCKYPVSKNAKKNLIGPTIKRGAKIGAGAVVLPGVTVGEYALVGAGAVVTKDILSGAVVVGNPTKVINKISLLRDKDGTKLY